jgi:histidine kinase
MTANDFMFSRKCRLLRHVAFWLSWHLGWACFLSLIFSTFTDNFIRIGIWIPAFMIYSFPISSVAIPKLLFKGKYLVFIGSLIFWLAVGWYLSVFYLKYVSVPVLELLHVPHGDNYEWQCFLCVITAAACFCSLSLGKQWLLKQKQFLQTQQAWMLAQQEKTNAELQLLKAQLHPHFLFNTLNNIYAFALENSPKTPQMILKLSSLLSYMLYECRTDEVLLEKEVEVMKHYIDIEKERYGDLIDISINIEGAIRDKFVSPLLILPFLENAFKHGASEQLERAWMSADVIVKGNTLSCKIVNSKNEVIPFREEGVGISNVKKRLDLLYPGRHDLKLTDEGDFFVVDLLLELNIHKRAPVISIQTEQQLKREKSNENSLLVDR